MTDISKTIARLAGVLKMPPSLPGYDLVSREDLRALLAAAEAGALARDAALEDAAAEVERFCALDPDSKAIEQYLFASIARRIRALKGAA